jgi:hypothetical protein
MFTLQSGEFTKMSEAGTDSRTVEGLRQLGNCQARLAHRGQVGIDTDLPPTAMDGAALEVNNWNNEVWRLGKPCQGPKAILVRKGNVAFGGALCVLGPADFAGPLRVGGVAVLAEGAIENVRFFAPATAWDSPITAAGGSDKIEFDGTAFVNNRVGSPQTPFSVSGDAITVNNTGNYRISFGVSLAGTDTAGKYTAKLTVGSTDYQTITIIVLNPCDLIAGVTNASLAHALTVGVADVIGTVTGFAASQGASTGGRGGRYGAAVGYSVSANQLVAITAGETVEVLVTEVCKIGSAGVNITPAETWITIESTDGNLGSV